MPYFLEHPVVTCKDLFPCREQVSQGVQKSVIKVRMLILDVPITHQEAK